MDILSFRDQIIDLLRETNQAVNTVFGIGYDKHGITIIQMMALHEILISGSQTIGDLGKRLNMSSGNISAMCKKLEKDGYLLRSRSKEDERVVQVTLSESGKQRLLAIDENIRQRYASPHQQFNREDMEMIIQGIEKLNQLLHTLLPDSQEK